MTTKLYYKNKEVKNYYVDNTGRSTLYYVVLYKNNNDMLSLVFNNRPDIKTMFYDN